MNMHYIIAIVPPEVVESLEEKLRNLHVGGITLTRVKGYGEYKNFFSNDWLSEYTKIEIFAEASKVDALLGVLRETGAADVPGSGIAAVIPVGTFFHLRTGAASAPTASDSPQPPSTK